MLITCFGCAEKYMHYNPNEQKDVSITFLPYEDTTKQKRFLLCVLRHHHVKI